MRNDNEGGVQIDPLDARISAAVVDAALAVHRALGPGLLESIYETCLAHELQKRGFVVERQVKLPVVYDGLMFEDGLRIDLLVERRVVCELKCASALHEVHTAQLLSYLRLSGCRLGLLINFFVPRLKSGLRRVLL